MLSEAITNLEILKEDMAVPRNVKDKVSNSISYLKEDDVEIAVKIDKVLQELDDLADDPNIPTYLRTQLWNIVSLLESV